MGLQCYPERPDLVVQAGQALCLNILEPILERFGNFAITFGYQSRNAIERRTAKSTYFSHYSSNPHQWDRMTFGEKTYARVDILPFCVEDNEVSKHEFGFWLMQNLDIDLLMQWTRSNVFCITISPKPRRVWLEWGRPSLGEPKKKVFMGADYWQRIYPKLPKDERPIYGPSSTNGRMY